MKAELVLRDKKRLANGAIMEMVVWKLLRFQPIDATHLLNRSAGVS
ncbi:MAG: hypothetical protein HY083_08620 [Gammaproteobacteria bacterium]|nr:hypothetical protein [Gammaproteobacteria bacterium]